MIRSLASSSIHPAFCPPPFALSRLDPSNLGDESNSSCHTAARRDAIITAIQLDGKGKYSRIQLHCTTSQPEVVIVDVITNVIILVQINEN